MAKRRIKDLTTTATAADLKTGNFLPLDGTEGTKKVPAELLKVPTSLAAFSDDAEHRLVTDDEKTAWDGKQDAMSVAADSATAFDNATTIMVAKSGGSLLTRTALALYNYIKGKADAVYAAISHTHSIAQVTNLQNSLDGKVDKVTGKSLSTNDYTTAEKNKLADIENEANKTVTDAMLSGTSTNPVQNKVVTATLSNKVNRDGSNATGTWGIGITGNAATATNAENADKVDGKHLQVLASVPDAYDPNSVYLIYGGN